MGSEQSGMGSGLSLPEPYYQDDWATIYHGDCREILPHLPKVDLVLTDPPYSAGRVGLEFAATGNIAVCLDLASSLARVMAVFGTSSGRGIEFLRSSIRRLPHNRVLAWHRSYVNSPAAGPWRWDLVLIHLFGKACFGRPEHSSLMTTDGTRSLALETGHPSPVPVDVMAWVAAPFSGTMLDPFLGSGTTCVAAKKLQRKSIGIEIEERYCEIAAKRLSQEIIAFEEIGGRDRPSVEGGVL